MADVNVKLQQLFNFWSVYQDQQPNQSSSPIIEPIKPSQSPMFSKAVPVAEVPSLDTFVHHQQQQQSSNVLHRLLQTSQQMNGAASQLDHSPQPPNNQTIELFQSVYEQVSSSSQHISNNDNVDNNNLASISNNDCSIDNSFHPNPITSNDNNVSPHLISSASPSTFDLNTFLLSAAASSSSPVSTVKKQRTRRSSTKKVAQNSPMTTNNNNNLNNCNSASQTDSDPFEDIIKEFKIPGEILDDLASRFILNMPQEEKDDPIRICFQIEIAFWFYLDFYCESIPELPRFKLKRFAFIMFSYIPRLRKLLSVFDQVITNWIDYKFSIPCSGAVLLDKTMNYVLLVQGYGSKNWSFPKGKVNHDETLANCAIREVLEETGYDCTDKIRDGIYLERKIFESRVRLFIVIGVEMDFNFRPHVRNEIRSIQWFLMQDLPMKVQKKIHSVNFASKFFTVIPFVYNIRKWIDKERKRQKKEARDQRKRSRMSSNETDDSQKESNGDSGSCGEGGSNAGWEMDDTNGSISVVNRDLTASVSPFTIMEDPNESTSFVDVKLDDILNLSYSTNVSTQTITNASSGNINIKEQSVGGFNVFNADDDDYESDTKNVAESVGSSTSSNSAKQQQWQTNWQGLLSEYNRLSLTNGNSNNNNNNNECQQLPQMTSPFHNNLINQQSNVQSSAPQSIPSNNNRPEPDSHQMTNGGSGHSLLSNLILNSHSPIAVSNGHYQSSDASVILPSTPLPPMFNSINSCDDKLSLLFGMTKNQNNQNGFTTTVQQPPPPSPIVNSFSSFNNSSNSNNNNSGLLQQSPFAKLSNLMPNVSSNSASQSMPISSSSNRPNSSANSLQYSAAAAALSINGITPTAATTTNQSTSYILKPVPAPIGTAAPLVNRYNGLDQKNLPLVETKIQQLLERFKFLNAN